VTRDALLVLEDGTAFRGRSLGAAGESFGEVVFNTGMSGYQEVLTDPSYAGQIVVMTYPQQGNYGVNHEDPESGAVRVAGFAVREASRRPSSWRSEAPLGEYLAAAGVVAIEDIDTRALTLRIREAGAMRAAVSTEDLDPGSLARRTREHPEMLGADLARTVSADEPWDAADVTGPPAAWHGRTFRVAAYDWGLKRNSLRLLARSGCRTTVLPALTPPEDVLHGAFDGVFLSNGPGDPAATSYAVDAARALLGRVPVFGICLGHQVLGRAIGAATYKLKFGHRGANQPVLDLESGRVEVTSHNHGFAVDPRSLVQQSAGRPRVVDSDFGRVALTHWNLNDGTLEGMRLLEVPAFSVQYHPEAAPGPHDSAYLFDRFSDSMGGSGGVARPDWEDSDPVQASEPPGRTGRSA
jgi:carbamoyl-phosphate synthase small subunit